MLHEILEHDLWSHIFHWSDITLNHDIDIRLDLFIEFDLYTVVDVDVDCGLTSHSAIFQLYSDGTDVQFPNFDLLPGTHAMGS